MAQLEIPFGIKIPNPLPVDKYYYNNSDQPYTNTTQVTTQVVSAVRYKGQTFNVDGDEYWFKDGITDGDLVAKGGGGGVGISALVEDTSPQLGGDLDLNGNTITGLASVAFSNDYEDLDNKPSIPDISGFGDIVTYNADDFIPLTGTTEGNPITGNLQVKQLDGETFKLTYIDVNDLEQGLYFNDVDLTNEVFNGVRLIDTEGTESIVGATYGAAVVRTTSSDLEVTQIGVGNRNISITGPFSTFEGIKEAQDYSANYTDLSLVNKGYVNSRTTTYGETAPTSTDDETFGFIASKSRWVALDTQIEYLCIDATEGAAIWIPLQGSFTPINVTTPDNYITDPIMSDVIYYCVGDKITMQGSFECGSDPSLFSGNAGIEFEFPNTFRASVDFGLINMRNKLVQGNSEIVNLSIKSASSIIQIFISPDSGSSPAFSSKSFDFQITFSTIYQAPS